ncbi:hypothetical protein NPX99_07310, partial [Bartonella sp. 220]|uniref:hypothetical protein n=1 Tax=Bartonella sp. 220B TaxID=2967260 RepID=UPI0022A9BDAF
MHIGSGKPENTAVYNATEDAEIYFNAEWSDGVAIADQKTDRLPIHAAVNYQQKLQKAGLSGINVSAGLRYQF